MAELGDLLASRFERTCRLKEGIHLKELIENRKFEFTLDAPPFEDESEKESKIEAVFDYDDFAPFINLECVNEEDDPDSTPFEKMRKKMTPITEDDKIHKLILRHGSGDVIPASSVVYYHYNSYLESKDGAPFDSSKTRGEKPVRMQLGVGATFSGLEKSLLSMKVGEKSQFLIDPSYAFGKMGVPPRIPPNATILMEIELCKAVDCGAAVETDDILEEESGQFSDYYKKAKGFHVLGNDYFQQKNFSLALENYRKAERLLNQCKMTSDIEEEQYKKLLFKIYVNMCVVYNNPKMKSPEKVCIIAKEVFYYCPKLAQKSAKFFFCLGKAQLALCDFEKARQYLRKSLLLEPHNKDINDALAELEEKKKKYYEHEKITYQKIFQYKPPENKDLKKPDDEFIHVLKQELNDFVNGSSNRLQLPPGLTLEERKLCQKVAEELGLTYEDTIICGNQSIAIIK